MDTTGFKGIKKDLYEELPFAESGYACARCGEIVDLSNLYTYRGKDICSDCMEILDNHKELGL